MFRISTAVHQRLRNCAFSRITYIYWVTVVWTATTLQTSMTFVNSANVNDTQISIDETILQSVQSTNSSGRMNDPSVVRVELDMLFPVDIWLSMTSRGNITRRQRRKVLRNETFRWPSAEVPYTMDASFRDSEMNALNQAIAEYHKYTCIRFRPKRENDSDYVRIVGDGACASYVGRLGGAQELWLHPTCRKKSVIIHELGHALGFVHEHSRPDRDEYVAIYKQNIKVEYENDFTKYTSTDVDDGGIGYDYLSIMHYGQSTASRNGQRVIETKNPKFQAVIGRSKGLSFGDIKQSNIAYRCSERSRCRKKSCPGEGFVGQDCRCWCPSNSTGTVTEICLGCVDYDEFCQIFAQRGYCTKKIFMILMNDLCPRSCGRCT